jgi:hypothetical protein
MLRLDKVIKPWKESAAQVQSIRLRRLFQPHRTEFRG